MPDPENVIIIGSGPAAYTAALYSSRANLKPLVIEGEADASQRPDLPGGQLMITTDVENYPGFPEGVEGPKLMDLFRKQAERFGTRVESGWSDKVDFSKRPFKLSAGGRTWGGEAVVPAPGGGG